MASSEIAWKELTEATATLLDPKSYVKRFYEAKTRPDGRLFSQCRSTTIQRGILTKNAIGSALFTLKPPTNNDDDETSSAADGKPPATMVLAAVTLQVGQPASNQGDVMVGVHDMASSSASPSATTINVPILQSFLQRVLDAAIAAAKDDDNQQQQQQQQRQQHHPLVLIPGVAAMRLIVTVQILQAAGNVTDASLLACVAALLDANIPTCDAFEQRDGKIWWKDDDDNNKETFTKRLKLPILPIPLTMGLFVANNNLDKKEKHSWIVDPDFKEEECLSWYTLTVVVNGAVSETPEILLLDGSGKNAPIARTDLALAIQMAHGRAQEMRQLLL